VKPSVFHALVEAARVNEPVVLGLICQAKGSSPQKSGAKALFHGDGRITGTLGGGCLEAEVQRRALASLSSGLPSTFELLLDHDFGWDDGLICGGKVKGLLLPNAQSRGAPFWSELAERKRRYSWGIRSDFQVSKVSTEENEAATKVETSGWLFQETITPPCALWIAGAGHVARAVAPLADQLDFAVTVMDDRPALASTRFFPSQIALMTNTWESLLELPLPPVTCFGLIVTRGHRHDARVLQSWIHKPFAFLGMIGSRRKARTIFEHFLEERLAAREALDRVACPVGLDIESETVPEIAVSIIAQLIQKRAAARSQAIMEDAPPVSAVFQGTTSSEGQVEDL
jgi:xanthine dehydrogenase accessory factor